MYHDLAFKQKGYLDPSILEIKMRYDVSGKQIEGDLTIAKGLLSNLNNLNN